MWWQCGCCCCGGGRGGRGCGGGCRRRQGTPCLLPCDCEPPSAAQCQPPPGSLIRSAEANTLGAQSVSPIVQSVGAGLCARPFPVIASRHRRRSNPYSRGNPSLRSVPGDSFAPPGARYFCLQRQKYPKTPLRNYVSKDFLSRYAHPCSNLSPRDRGK